MCSNNFSSGLYGRKRQYNDPKMPQAIQIADLAKSVACGDVSPLPPPLTCRTWRSPSPVDAAAAFSPAPVPRRPRRLPRAADLYLQFTRFLKVSVVSSGNFKLKVYECLFTLQLIHFNSPSTTSAQKREGGAKNAPNLQTYSKYLFSGQSEGGGKKSQNSVYVIHGSPQILWESRRLNWI